MTADDVAEIQTGDELWLAMGECSRVHRLRVTEVGPGGITLHEPSPRPVPWGLFSVAEVGRWFSRTEAEAVRRRLAELMLAVGAFRRRLLELDPAAAGLTPGEG